MDEKIIIIGAGVSGITTALVLQILGFSTKIYAERLPADLNKQGSPTFASLYPSASVIPHSVYSDHLETLFEDSQSIFYKLKKQSFPGLSVHKHFEIFEFEKTQPKYLQWMKNLEWIDKDKKEFPRRPIMDKAYGWSFDCIFADWPIYFPALMQIYRENGGEVITKKVKSKDIASLPASTIINCSGMGSSSLFDDQKEQLLMRGHLFHKQPAPLIKNGDNKVISYNYTPEASVYADSGGQPCDVYCYPRQDGWILGGSRQAGTVTKDGRWKGDKRDSLHEMDETSFPPQIIDLNRQIIEYSFKLPFGDIEDLSPVIGYRYIRSKNNGLRLDSETLYGKEIYHNYGHGGAGVTLSWGCAMKIAEQIDQHGNNSDELKNKLISLLKDADIIM